MRSQESFVLRNHQVHGKKCDLSLQAPVRSSEGAGRCVVANFDTLQTINLFLLIEKQDCKVNQITEVQGCNFIVIVGALGK